MAGSMSKELFIHSTRAVGCIAMLEDDEEVDVGDGGCEMTAVEPGVLECVMMVVVVCLD